MCGVSARAFLACMHACVRTCVRMAVFLYVHVYCVYVSFVGVCVLSSCIHILLCIPYTNNISHNICVRLAALFTFPHTRTHAHAHTHTHTSTHKLVQVARGRSFKPQQNTVTLKSQISYFLRGKRWQIIGLNLARNRNIYPKCTQTTAAQCQQRILVYQLVSDICLLLE